MFLIYLTKYKRAFKFNDCYGAFKIKIVTHTMATQSTKPSTIPISPPSSHTIKHNTLQDITATTNYHLTYIETYAILLAVCV